MKKIKLYGKGGEGKFVLVDNEDYIKYNKYHLRLKNSYAFMEVWKNGKRKHIYLHRLIMDCPKGMNIDHIDHNRLNNQKFNLRICTTKQNIANQKIRIDNTSGYSGVHWSNVAKKWQAVISINGINKYIGIFDNKRHAALARDLWAKDLYKDYAHLNFRPISTI